MLAAETFEIIKVKTMFLSCNLISESSKENHGFLPPK